MIKQLALATALLLSLPVAATNEWSEVETRDDWLLLSRLESEDGLAKTLSLSTYDLDVGCRPILGYRDIKVGENQESSRTDIDIEIEIEITADDNEPHVISSKMAYLTLADEYSIVDTYFFLSDNSSAQINVLHSEPPMI